MLPPCFLSFPSSGNPKAGCSRGRRRKRPNPPSYSRADQKRALLPRLSLNGRDDHDCLLTGNKSEVPYWLDGETSLPTPAPSIEGDQFMLVDVATGVKRPAFDQAHLAAVLDKPSHVSCKADGLTVEARR